ncbi:MAG: DUF4266 domain-containing protein [Myxococcota bacterium]
MYKTILASLALVVLGGCATVSPYEREHLTRPGMDVTRENSEAGFHAHVHDSREGATGGHGSTGGGCGCN